MFTTLPNTTTTTTSTNNIKTHVRQTNMGDNDVVMFDVNVDEYLWIDLNDKGNREQIINNMRFEKKHLNYITKSETYIFNTKDKGEGDKKITIPSQQFDFDINLFLTHITNTNNDETFYFTIDFEHYSDALDYYTSRHRGFIEQRHIDEFITDFKELLSFVDKIGVIKSITETTTDNSFIGKYKEYFLHNKSEPIYYSIIFGYLNKNDIVIDYNIDPIYKFR